MTTPLSLLQRAKQGDAVAIAVLMNEVLQEQDISAKVMLDDRCLQVMLKGRTALHQAHCIAFIRRGLLRLQPEAISQVTAYAWRSGEAFPSWIAAFSLEPTPLPQCQLNGQRHIIAASPEKHLGSQPDSQTLAITAQTALQPSRSTTNPSKFKQRSEVFKFSVVIMVMTVVYFMMTGV